MSEKHKIAGLMRTHHCGELTEKNVGETVCLTGWVNKYRNLGSLHFIDLRDRYGLTQLGFESFKGEISILKECSLESVIKVEGVVQKRPDNALNKEMTTGEIEIAVSHLEILSQASELPFLPHGSISATEDLRLKYRYLDLRTNRLQSVLQTRSATYQATREALYELDFTEVETPILYKTTPEGARDYLVPSRVHRGKFYALPQSPQTLKQLLMIGNTDKYFQICKCFRDEDLRAERQPEFTQLDIEVSFATEEYLRNLTEHLIRRWFKLGKDFCLPIMSYDEAMRDYGSDKPDLRYGLKHHIVGEFFKESSFKLFSQIEKAGGLIKGIFLPQKQGALTRKEIDSLVEVIKPYGGQGVAWFKTEKGNLSGGISKFITEDIKKSLIDIDDQDGLWLFFASENHKVAHNCADAVRRHLGVQLGLIKKDHFEFVWVNNFPLLDYDEKEQRFYACHHPFTAPHEDEQQNFYSEDLEVLKNLKAQAYDIICNGYELGGGSLRIFNEKMQAQMFKLLGMTKEEVDHQFGFFVEALKYGTPPHAGIAFGFDRLTMVLCQTDNIRDVIAFPKTNSATDLMAQAPSTADQKQLDELALSIKK